jgi:hypothetical protein
MNPLFETNLYAQGNLVTHSICNSLLIIRFFMFLPIKVGLHFFKDVLDCE